MLYNFPGQLPANLFNWYVPKTEGGSGDAKSKSGYAYWDESKSGLVNGTLEVTDERKRETKRRNELDVCLALLRYDLRLVFYTKLRARYKYVH